MINSVISCIKRYRFFLWSFSQLIIFQCIISQSSFATENSLTPPPTVFSTTDSTVCSNDLPIIWNGLTFTASGSQTATLISSSNEDSLATLNLTVVPAYNFGYSLIVCENQLPFSWLGLTFTGPGAQTAFLTSSLNCDSIININLVVIPFLTLSKDTVVCSNEVPFVWNGLTFTQSGSQSYMITSPVNCNILSTLNLTVIPPQASTTNLTICSTALPYSWNGLTFNGSGTQSTVLTTSQGCDSTVTLNLTVVPLTSSTTTLTICSNQLPYSWNGLTFFVPGTQTTTIPSSQNCDSVVTLVLSAVPASYSFSFATVCADELPYVWNGLTFTSSATQTITFSNSIGCDSIASFSLTVNPNTYTYSFATVCESDLPFIWNGLTFNATGIQTAILTNSFGCNFYATMDLVVRPTLYSTTNLTICETDLPYVWNGFTLTEAGMQMVTLTSSINCDSIATLNLSVTPTSSSSIDLVICESQLPYVWNGLTFTSAGTQVATLTSFLNCDSLATLNLTVNPVFTSTTDLTICETELPLVWNNLTFTAAGSQTANLWSVASCDSLATLNLSVTPTPIAPSIVDSTFYCDSELLQTLVATPNSGGNLTWFADENLETQLGTGTELVPEFQLGSITYYVVETVDDCPGPLVTSIVTIEVCPTDIPTAFTPDGDGVNDTWQITAIDENYPNAFIQVYNRWGTLLFEHQSSPSNPYGPNAWNGTFEDQDLPVSSYFYLVNYNDEKSTPVLKGTVSIIRE